MECCCLVGQAPGTLEKIFLAFFLRRLEDREGKKKIPPDAIELAGVLERPHNPGKIFRQWHPQLSGSLRLLALLM